MGRRKGIPDSHKAVFEFLCKHEDAKKSFTVKELAGAGDWEEPSTRTTIRRQLKGLVVRSGDTCTVAGVRNLTLEAFGRTMSQDPDRYREPLKPALDPEVDALVSKARHSALTALQAYNSPFGGFRTETYAVLMMVAWTALAQAELTQAGVKFDQLDRAGRPITVDGERKAWELGQCLDNLADLPTPVRKNIDLFVRLRNWVVHRGVRKLDAAVSGEAQALLLNFDERLSAKFGSYFSIGQSLALPLVATSVADKGHLDAVSRVQAKHFDEVMKLVSDYRRSLDDSVFHDQRYIFKVFVMPRPASRQSTAQHAIEFLDLADAPDEVNTWIQSRVIAVKEKTQKVPVPNLGNRLPGAVVDEVATRTGLKFTISMHTVACVRYAARTKAPDGKTKLDPDYCLEDDATKRHVFTPKWIDFLVAKIVDPQEQSALRTRNSVGKKPV